MPGGAQRCPDVAGDNGGHPARFDLMMANTIAMRRLAQTYGEGSVKYGDNNWRKGFPESNLVNHALAHINMHLTGDRTEDHLSHAVWNLVTLMHFQENRPELMDISGSPVESKSA